MAGLFVTATGTDVGKTFVTTGIIRALKSQGRKVDALKPVISGYDPATADASDAGRLLEALGWPVTPAQIDRISPWRFAAPLSPDMAARREGHAIDFAALVDFCRKAVARAEDALLIEGVGGVMVPLDDRHTVLDWMAALDLPVLLVTGSYLGTLSHTLTALEVLRGRGLKVRAIAISESEGSTVDLSETKKTLATFAGALEIVVVPRREAGATDHPAFDRLAALV